jgi:cobalamin biosynthesis Mg chelatase CobN
MHFVAVESYCLMAQENLDGGKKSRSYRRDRDRSAQAEPGPSILLILIVSVVLAVTVLGALWFIFFRT